MNKAHAWVGFMSNFNLLIVSSDQNFCGEMVQVLRNRGVPAGAESELPRTLERAISARATHVFISNEFHLAEIRQVAHALEARGLLVVLFVRDCGQELPLMLKSQLRLSGFKSILMPPISATRIDRKLLILQRERERVSRPDSKINGQSDRRGLNAQGLGSARANEHNTSQSGQQHIGFTRNRDDLIVIKNKSEPTSERVPVWSNVAGDEAHENASTFVRGGGEVSAAPKLMLPPGTSELSSNVQLVADAIEATLAQLVSKIKWPGQTSLQSADMGSAIFVRCDGFSGLVVVTNVIEHRLHAFDKIDDFNQFLSEELKNLGQQFAVQESYPVPLDLEKFRALAANSAEFVFECQRGETPLLVSLFSSQTIFPSLRQVDEGKMCAVSFKEIEPGVRLNFDVYLRLPNNNKYFRYVNSNRYLMPEQKERLVKKQGAEFEVFVSEDEADNLRQYCAGQYFNKPVDKKKVA